MSDWDDPRPVHVRGGSDGVAADVAEIQALAGRFGEVARETLEGTLSLHAYLVDASTWLSAVFDPVGFAEFEVDLLSALDGWQGLSFAALECGAIELELRLAAEAYETADHLATTVHDLALGGIQAPVALGAGAVELARSGDPLRAAQAVIASDPELADTIVTALGIPALLRAIAGTIPDGHAVLRHPGQDRSPSGARPPHRLTDVVAGLARRNRDGRHGAVDVRILTLPDGSRRAIVDITGTKSWDPLPTSDVTSLTTNGRALVGARTAYERGVLTAMRAAGVGPHDPVLLVGHSEGGMVALTAARDAVGSGEFDITHVVTVGSPIGLTAGDLPSTVQLLAIENSRDVVPHLDGVANPDRTNVTTVTGERGDGTVLGDHSLDTAYVPLAGDVEASHDESVRHFLTGAVGFFRATEVETRTYQIARRY